MAFTIKKGDLRPLFVVVLKDNFGEPEEEIVDLTDATAVWFNMRATEGGAVKIDRGSADITDEPGGEVTYEWDAADTDTAGNYEAEVEVVWSDAKPETFPNDSYWEVVIPDDIA